MTDFKKPTWAAVVRSGPGDGDVQRQKIEEMEAKLKEENKRRDRDRKELEDQKKHADDEEEKKRLLAETGRQEATDRVKDIARQVTNEDRTWNDDSDDMEDASLLLEVAEATGKENSVALSNSQDFDSGREAKEKALLTAIKHKS